MLRYRGLLLASILILAQFGQVQFFDVFAEDELFPNWVFKIFEFWYYGEITDEEFIYAMKWYRNLNTVQSVIEREDDIKTNFLITPSMSKQKESSLTLSNCSSDWYITGYFTPIESDYSGDLERIAFGDYIKHFRSDFLTAVKTEGWGKTMLGDYVGWYDNSFHLSDVALDMHGDELLITSVAVDTTLIEQKTKLVIPTLPSPWNEQVFTATDIGPSIKGKHIDVFTGEGKQAELETFRITGTENKVCIETLQD